MDSLKEKIKETFRFGKGSDNLPILAMSPRPVKKHGRHMLAEVMGTMKLNKGVEIGVRGGGSAELWCQYNPDIELTCIDPWLARKRWSQERQDVYYERAKERLAPYNVKILKATSMECLSLYDNESLDFVHIDGCHEFDYCCPDIIYWSKKVKKGGFMIVHDYCVFQTNGVMKAVDAYTHCHRIDPWYVTRDRIPTAFWINP